MKTALICQGFDLAPRVLETEFKKLSLAENVAPQPPNLLPISSDLILYSYLILVFIAPEII